QPVVDHEQRHDVVVRLGGGDQGGVVGQAQVPPEPDDGRRVTQKRMPMSNVDAYPLPSFLTSSVSWLLDWRKVSSCEFRVRLPLLYGEEAYTWLVKESSKNSCDVNSWPPLRILKWMWTARPWYEPG